MSTGMFGGTVTIELVCCFTFALSPSKLGFSDSTHCAVEGALLGHNLGHLATITDHGENGTFVSRFNRTSSV